MKTILSFIAISILSIAGYTYYTHNTSLSKAEFIDYRNEWRLEIDSIQTVITKTSINVDSILNQSEIIKTNTDSIKQGQEKIFDEVKKDKTVSFWDLF